MSLEQMLIVGLFLWGCWRHDMVAVGALLACVFAGLVSYAEAFAGFAHPAAITVACVLVLSHGLQTSGAVDALTRRALPAKAGPTLGQSVADRAGSAARAGERGSADRRAPEQHPDPGPRGLPHRRLLAARPAARDPARGGHPADAVVGMASCKQLDARPSIQVFLKTRGVA